MSSVFFPCAVLTRLSEGRRVSRRRMQLGTRACTDADGRLALYAAGGDPYMRPKVVVNEPTLADPP